MKLFKYLFGLLLFTIPVKAAAPQVYLGGSTQYERDRILRLEHTLNFSREPMLSPWTIRILDEETFLKYVRENNLSTYSAYTNLFGTVTSLNEGYLEFAIDSRVRHTLAHEAGHVICQCASEDKANEIAYQLEK